MSHHSNRDAYLDLLAKVVLNAIYEDPSIHPQHGNRFVQEHRTDGHDWPQVAHTMIGSKRIANLRFAIETVLTENILGDFIETGVWRGGACIFMQGVLKAYGAADRRIYVADSFAGLPPPDPDRFPADTGDAHHSFDELSVSRAQVEENFRKYGLLDDNVLFIEGFFEDTLPNSDLGPLAIARLDGDMYSSTIVALETLYPKLSEGGFLIVDDYGALPNCRQAVDDYRAAHSISDPMKTIDWTGIYWRKNRK
jgi:O-methyltransferase